MEYRTNPFMAPPGMEYPPMHDDETEDAITLEGDTVEQQAVSAIKKGVFWWDLPDDVRDFFESRRVTEEGYQKSVQETRFKMDVIAKEADPQMSRILSHLTDTESFGTLQMYELMVERWKNSDPKVLEKLKQAVMSVSEGIEDEDYDDNRIFSAISFGVNTRTSFPKGKELFDTVLNTYLDFLKQRDELDDLYKGDTVDLEKCKQELREQAEKSFFGSGGLLRLSAHAFAETVEKNYEHVNAQATAFAIVFRNAVKYTKETGEMIDFKDFAGTELEVKAASELDEKTKDEIIKIFTENRKDNPKYQLRNPETGETWSEHLVAGIRSAMEAGDKTEFYILKHDNDIVGFIRFDDLGNKKYHVASFNVNAAYKDGKIGGIIFKTALQVKGQDNYYVMEAEAGNAALPFYTEGLGFTAGKPIENYEGFGNTYIPLERGNPEAKPETAAST